MNFTDTNAVRASRGGRNREALDYVDRVLCPSCGKTRIKTTEYVCAYCMEHNQQLDPPRLVAEKPRYERPSKRGPNAGTACSRCPVNIQLMCVDRCNAGRHVLCEIPTEEELRMEHEIR